MNKVRKGDVFRCIKTVYIDGGECNVAYLRDKLYLSEKDNCITNESGLIEHWWVPRKGKNPLNEFFIYIGNVSNKDCDEKKIVKGKGKNSRVSHPSHYTWLKDLCGIEVIDIARHMNFNLGNVVKYVLRSGHKSEQGMSNKQKQIEDLKKARFYIDDEIRRLENDKEGV